MTSKMPDLQLWHKNDHFLADLQTYDGKGSFSDWIVQEKIANLTKWLELQLARAKTKSIVYKLIQGMSQSSTWQAVNIGLFQAFSPIATNMHVAIRIHSRPQTTNETLQECIQRFTDLAIQNKGADPSRVTCQVTIKLFIRHLFN